MRHPAEEDEEFLNSTDELLDTLRAIDRHRRELQAAADFAQTVLDSDPALSRQWSEFTRAGGITATDFRLFLAGRFRTRRVRQRRHLRLVASQKRRSIMLRSHGYHGDAA